MKTAINDTLDWIDRFKKMNGHCPSGDEITAQLVMQLPKEREQIEQAYSEGKQSASGHEFDGTTSQDYFKQTYTL